MLEGLEISEINLANLYHSIRIDAETYRPFYLDIENKVKSIAYTTLGNVSSKLKKGIFDIKSDTYSEYGIPFVRISNLREMSIDEEGIIFIPESENEKNKDTFLSKGDIILSKTAYPAASIVSVKCCNTSQDTVAIKLKKDIGINSGFLTTFLNTKYGFYQMQRWFTGNIQMHLNLTDCKEIFIPKFDKSFQNVINEIVWDSLNTKQESKQSYQQAETLLLEAVGLHDFAPSQENTNVKSFQDSFLSSGRLDAEYYQPKYEDLISSFSETIETKCIGEIQTFNRRGLQPIYVDEGEYDVINSKHIKEDHLDYDGFERTDERNFNGQSIAHVQQYDVLTYTTGAYVGRTNVYLKNIPALASNHVNILRLKIGYDPIYVGYVMNSLIGRMQTERVVSGSAQAELYPKDIASFIIPFPSKDVQNQIKDRIKQSLGLKSQSKKLLEVAKRAVEIAIEEDETAAMRYIEENSVMHE